MQYISKFVIKYKAGHRNFPTSLKMKGIQIKYTIYRSNNNNGEIIYQSVLWAGKVQSNNLTFSHKQGKVYLFAYVYKDNVLMLLLQLSLRNYQIKLLLTDASSCVVIQHSTIVAE